MSLIHRTDKEFSNKEVFKELRFIRRKKKKMAEAFERFINSMIHDERLRRMLIATCKDQKDLADIDLDRWDSYVKKSLGSQPEVINACMTQLKEIQSFAKAIVEDTPRDVQSSFAVSDYTARRFSWTASNAFENDILTSLPQAIADAVDWLTSFELTSDRQLPVFKKRGNHGMINEDTTGHVEGTLFLEGIPLGDIGVSILEARLKAIDDDGVYAILQSLGAGKSGYLFRLISDHWPGSHGIFIPFATHVPHGETRSSRGKLEALSIWRNVESLCHRLGKHESKTLIKSVIYAHMYIYALANKRMCGNSISVLVALMTHFPEELLLSLHEVSFLCFKDAIQRAKNCDQFFEDAFARVAQDIYENPEDRVVVQFDEPGVFYGKNFFWQGESESFKQLILQSICEVGATGVFSVFVTGTHLRLKDVSEYPHFQVESLAKPITEKMLRSFVKTAFPNNVDGNQTPTDVFNWDDIDIHLFCGRPLFGGVLVKHLWEARKSGVSKCMAIQKASDELKQICRKIAQRIWFPDPFHNVIFDDHAVAKNHYDAARHAFLSSVLHGEGESKNEIFHEVSGDSANDIDQALAGGAFLVLPGNEHNKVNLCAESCMLDAISDLCMQDLRGLLTGDETKMEDDHILRLLCHQGHLPHIQSKTVHGDLTELIFVWLILRCSLITQDKRGVSLKEIFKYLVPASHELPGYLENFFVKVRKAANAPDILTSETIDPEMVYYGISTYAGTDVLVMLWYCKDKVWKTCPWLIQAKAHRSLTLDEGIASVDPALQFIGTNLRKLFVSQPPKKEEKGGEIKFTSARHCRKSYVTRRLRQDKWNEMAFRTLFFAGEFHRKNLEYCQTTRDTNFPLFLLCLSEEHFPKFVRNSTHANSNYDKELTRDRITLESAGWNLKEGIRRLSDIKNRGWTIIKEEKEGDWDEVDSLAEGVKSLGQKDGQT